MKNIFLAFLLMTNFSFAAGTLNLVGLVKSIDEKTIDLESGNKVYTLSRPLIGQGQDQLVKKTSKNKPVSLAVPFEAVEQVKNIKSK